MSRHKRQVVLSGPAAYRDMALEAGRIRREAEARHSEVDLLVVALKDHIRDLQLERDELLREVARLRDETRRATAEWLPRGMKGPRQL